MTTSPAHLSSQNKRDGNAATSGSFSSRSYLSLISPTHAHLAGLLRSLDYVSAEPSLQSCLYLFVFSPLDLNRRAARLIAQSVRVPKIASEFGLAFEAPCVNNG